MAKKESRRGGAPPSPRDEGLYSIGEVSRIGSISRRSLRHYDALEIIEPDKIGENNYRYYSRRTMLKIPVIRYLRDMGVSLEEIAEVFRAGDFGRILEVLHKGREECEVEAREVAERLEVINDWNDLINEANFILGAGSTHVSVRYASPQTYLSMPYHFFGDYADATINLDFTAFVKDSDNVISGPVIMRRELGEGAESMPRVQEEADVLMLQKALRPVAPGNQFERAGGMFLSTYHTGPMEELGDAYERLGSFAAEHDYRLEGCAYERFVTDYWTTYDPSLFVTEVLLPISPP